MHLRHLAWVGLVASVAVMGCGHRREPVGTTDTSTVRQIRETYQRVDPNAKVGLVIAILPDNGLAALGDLPVAEFQNGDVLVLMDTNQKIIGAGHVVNKTADALHVRYDVAANGRAPQVGDLAVRAQ